MDASHSMPSTDRLFFPCLEGVARRYALRRNSQEDEQQNLRIQVVVRRFFDSIVHQIAVRLSSEYVSFYDDCVKLPNLCKSSPSLVKKYLSLDDGSFEPFGELKSQQGKGLLVKKNFTEDEKNSSHAEVAAFYDPWKTAGAQMQANYAVQIPPLLMKMQSCLVPEFGFQLQPDMWNESGPSTYAPQSHRAWGANLDTLFRLSSGLCYPANRVEIGCGSYIQAEAPKASKLNSKLHYYQMAVESGSELLVAASTGFRRKNQDDIIEVTSDAETMDFLNLREMIDLSDSMTIQCLEEERIPLSDKVRHHVDLTGDCFFHVRTLVVYENSQEKRRIYQIVPDFIPVAYPFGLSQNTVTFVNLFATSCRLNMDSEHPVIVNCITGRDRSGQFIVLDSMYKDVQAVRVGGNSVDDVLEGVDVVDQMLIRANQLALQSTEGAGIDSMEQTLLPNFFKEIPHASRIKYFDLCEDDKTHLHRDVNLHYRQILNEMD